MLKVIQDNKLLLPQEIEVWYVLPAIRKEFALAMITAGLSQKKVAEIIGVTEAAVSQYKKEKRAHGFTFDEAFKSEVRQSVECVIQQPHLLFEEMMRIDNYIKQSGLFCRIHRSKSWTPHGCEAVCGQHFLKSSEKVTYSAARRAQPQPSSPSSKSSQGSDVAPADGDGHFFPESEAHHGR